MAPAVKTKMKATPKKRPVVTAKARPNTSILNFFAKVEKEETLFVETKNAGVSARVAGPGGKEEEEGGLYDYHGDDYNDDYPGGYHDSTTRFNEDGAPRKRRRVSSEDDGDSARQIPQAEEGSLRMSSPGRRKPAKKKGPFVDDSDSDGEEGPLEGRSGKDPITTTSQPPPSAQSVTKTANERREHSLKAQDEAGSGPNAHDRDDDDVTEEDLFGEEYRERHLMEELDRLEAGETGLLPYHEAPDPWPDDSAVEACPICDGSLEGLGADDATRHVNACLDGAAEPLALTPAVVEDFAAKPLPKAQPHGDSKRLSCTAVLRPRQANPLLDTKPTPTRGASAFAKLMSGRAEDTAWAEAAAAEQSSRGKQAYQRTCPFYKIMPGFSICVDAFRYGAVAGCRAYFLSHFHSDHYIGLTSSWAHGPIYCSRVTGTLVKQQLRVAARWVVELDFETSVDIPGTDGVCVTMIPANHCPGSSLFLFEKKSVGGSGARTQRILHCGDFRACPAHVTHPLLRPEVCDAVSGKVRHQTIDICYLDTTYLDPRYSFPPQAQVVQACANFCAGGAISKRPVGEAGNVGRFLTKGDRLDTATATSTTPSTTPATTSKPSQRLLVVCGTYSIGKERICIAIAKALDTLIFAIPRKQRICAALDDPELSALLTSNPREAQVHMQAFGEMNPSSLREYLDTHRPHFGRVVGFRPSGWNYRPPSSASTTAAIGAGLAPGGLPTTQLLHGRAWRARFRAEDLVPQRGSTAEAACFGVPYSEHSSFRELALFVMALRIERIVPTVNVGSEAGRRRMRVWTDRWVGERRRGGFVVPLEGVEEEGEREKLWEGKDGRGGGVWW